MTKMGGAFDIRNVAKPVHGGIRTKLSYAEWRFHMRMYLGWPNPCLIPVMYEVAK